MIIYRDECCLIFHPQMTQILYFFSAYDKNLGEVPLIIRVVCVICG